MTTPFRNYSFMLECEKNFDVNEFLKWFHHFRVNSFFFAAAYLAFVFIGPKWMAQRKPYELRGPLICWNIAIAVFSTLGALRTIPEVIHVTRNIGLHHSVCVASNYEDKVAGFWTALFVLSKLPEFGDTVFIVLRKKKLIFLHWYHHAIVLVYSWYATGDSTATSRWFVTTNCIVHVAMYSYFALKAMRIRVPIVVAMAITVAEILQMVVGVTVNVLAYQIKRSGQACGVTDLNIKVALLMYLSFFVLFARFFYDSYVVNRAKKALNGDVPRTTSSLPTAKKIQ